MKKAKFKLLTALFIILFMTGCSSTEIPDSEPDDADVQESAPQIESWSTTVMGTVSHGLQREELGEGEDIVYTGGEMLLPYTVTASGDATNIGFLMFMNGQPQSYHTGGNDELLYCHVFQLEDNVPKQFDFYFTPVIGEEGETVELTVLSLYYPDFKPDMKQTSGYGMYHQILAAVFDIQMESSALPDGQKAEDFGVITDAALYEEEITRDYLSQFMALNYGMQEITEEDLDSNIYNVLLFDGERVSNNLSVSSDSIEISYDIFGTDGSEFCVIPYMDHMPVSGAQSVTVSKGKVSRLVLHIDPDALDEMSTFYILAIPVNDDGNLYPIKTSSILLYKTEAASAATGNGEYAENPAHTTASLDDTKFEGGIRNICYAGANKLLVYTDSFYLYDTVNDTIIGQYQAEESNLVIEGFTALSEGYALITSESGLSSASEGYGIMTYSSYMSRNVTCRYFDNNLVLQQAVNLDNILSSEAESEAEFFILSAEISPDGTEIAVMGINAMYIYDVKEGSLTAVVTYRDEEELSDIYNVSFTGQGNSLVFAGGAILSDNSNSVNIYGIVSLDDGSIEYHTSPEYILCGKLIDYGDEIWFPADETRTAGKMLITDADCRSAHIVELEGNDPAGDVYGSDQGRYIATSMPLPEQNGLRIRIYNSDDGTLVCELRVEDEEWEYFTATPQVLVLDELDECIVLTGIGRDTRLFSFFF